MEKNRKFQIFIITTFFLVTFLIYQLPANNTYIYYKGISAFFSLELLEFFILYNNNKNLKNFRLNLYLFTVLNFLLINYFYYLGEKYIEILLFSSLLLFLSTIHSFLFFLIEEILFYFKYMLVSLVHLLFLIHLTVPMFPPKKEEISYIIIMFYIIYIFMIFLFKEFEKKEKSKLLIFKEKEEKKYENYTFIIARILIYLLLFCSSIIHRDIHYQVIIIFATFELFGIIIFYKKIFFMNNLKRKLKFYLLFNFLLTIIFYYLGKEFILFIKIILIFVPFIFSFFYLISSLIKREIFYLIYSLILLLWWIFFIMLNFGGLPPELGEYKLDAVDIFLAYIVISCLYLPLFKKNESKRVDE